MAMMAMTTRSSIRVKALSRTHLRTVAIIPPEKKGTGRLHAQRRPTQPSDLSALAERTNKAERAQLSLVKISTDAIEEIFWFRRAEKFHQPHQVAFSPS